MSFSSPLFIFVFLPFVIAGHYLVSGRFQNLFLLLSSIVFYIFTDIPHLLPIICLIAVNFQCGLMLRSQQNPGRQRLYLAIAVACNILVLFYFKYSMFIVDNVNAAAGWLGLSAITIQKISAPLGLSFIIFQIIAYLIDSYNEVTEPQKSITRFALFVLFFSKITAGPIVRHNEVADSLSSRTVALDDFVYGLKRFIIGLSKKILIADVLAKTVDQAFSLPQNELAAGAMWLVILCYSLQIYYDFSGYSDMAIGIGKMLGFTFQENFDNPYRARSLTDFWRRWHISLSTWLKDYLFIPLSYALTTETIRKKVAAGSFKLKYVTATSIMIMFTLCGLWHGAAWTFVAWGVLHGLMLALESLGLSKTIKSWWQPFQHLYTLVIIMVTWAFFRSPSLDYAISCLKSMFFLSAGKTPFNAILPFASTREVAITLGIAILFVLPVNDIISTLKNRRGNLRPAGEAPAGTYLAGGISCACYLTLLILSLAYLSSMTYNPFLYGNF